MYKTLFVLLLIVIFMTAGCSSVQQPTQIAESTSVPTEEGTAPKYQFELLTEDEKEVLLYLMDLYPEEDMVNTRQKFMDAMDDYLSKHDAEGILPSPYHYFLMFLTYRGGLLGGCDCNLYYRSASTGPWKLPVCHGCI